MKAKAKTAQMEITNNQLNAGQITVALKSITSVEIAKGRHTAMGEVARIFGVIFAMFGVLAVFLMHPNFGFLFITVGVGLIISARFCQKSALVIGTPSGKITVLESKDHDLVMSKKVELVNAMGAIA